MTTHDGRRRGCTDVDGPFARRMTRISDDHISDDTLMWPYIPRRMTRTVCGIPCERLQCIYSEGRAGRCLLMMWSSLISGSVPTQDVVITD